MQQTRYPYIGFEGLIGSGKTTLATQLAHYIHADVMLESFAANSFLSDFYTDQDRWALPMQLWFLITRIEDTSRFSTVTGKPLVTDYTALKEDIFARTLLRVEREYALYRRIADALRRSARVPDVTVYLEARNEILLERIRQRNRPNEKYIDGPYLDRLRAAYESGLAESASRVIRLKAEDFDTREPSTLGLLWTRIGTALPRDVALPSTRKPSV